MVSTMPETDAQLVTRARRGDVAAFERIVARHREMLVATATARLGSAADAEDVAQEAFVRAFFHLEELRNPQALRPWLRRTADRLALMRLRGRREEPTAPEDLEALHPQRVGLPEDTARAEELLAELPLPMRQTLVLTELDGYTCAEAARLLGVSEGTVKSRLSRARAKLLAKREEEVMAEQPTDEFTARTIARLKEEARRLLAEGDLPGAAQRAHMVLAEQVKSYQGDAAEQGTAAWLAAWDSGSVKPDPEAAAMAGLDRKAQRLQECEANAAQYGLRLEELGWELEDVNQMGETLGRPTGHGADIWGVPVSRLALTIIDARALCQRLGCSPLTLHQWVNDGCPILRCWPWARFDLDRVQQWLAAHGITEWPEENSYLLERPIRIIFREVYAGSLSAEQADQVMHDLGAHAWDAPLPWFTGGWNDGPA
jgi:RNA polymerase sigma-70 factor (ECF subfamily)